MIFIEMKLLEGDYRFFPITNFSRQCGREGELRILGTVNNSGTQFHECGILFDGKEDGIQLQGIYFQGVDSGFSINSPVGSRSEFH